MDIGTLVERFFKEEFPDCTELIINSEDKDYLIAAKKKYDRSTIGYYKIYCESKTVIENFKKYYSLSFTFDKKY